MVSPAYADQVKVQVVIEDTVNGVSYRDAIYFPDMATYEAKVADGSFATERQARITNFDNAMKNPVPYVPPTKEQLIAEKVDLQSRIAVLDAEIKGK